MRSAACHRHHRRSRRDCRFFLLPRYRPAAFATHTHTHTVPHRIQYKYDFFLLIRVLFSLLFFLLKLIKMKKTSVERQTKCQFCRIVAWLMVQFKSVFTAWVVQSAKGQAKFSQRAENSISSSRTLSKI